VTLQTHEPDFGAIGVLPAIPPLVVGGTVAAAAVGALILLVQSATADDWSDKAVFQANMRKIHSAMLALQCLVGGAQAGQPLVDSLGATVCPGGTKPVCTLPAAKLAQWRSLRDNFAKFWTDSWGWTTVYISSAQAQQAKRFAIDFEQFYRGLQSTCGGALPNIPEPPPTPDTTPGWVKYATWGVGLVAVIALANSAKNIFGGSSTVKFVGAKESLKGLRGLTGLEDMHLRRIHVGKDGLDSKGRFWGHSNLHVYKVIDDEGFATFIRAKDTFDAAKQAQKHMRNVQLPRGLRG
jgi:hypothetical protein